MDAAEYKTILDRYIKFDDDGKYTGKGDELVTFDTDCSNAKVDLDVILADLIIMDPAKIDDDAKFEKNKRIESYLMSLSPNPNAISKGKFKSSFSRDEKIAWVKQHLRLEEKIAVLAEVQAFESIITGTNPYPKDVADARKQKSDAKQACFDRRKELKAEYQKILTDLDNEITSLQTKISEKERQLFEASQGIAGEKTPAVVTTQAQALITALNTEIPKLEKELAALEKLRNNATVNLSKFNALVEQSLRDYKLFEKEESKKDEKSDEKSSGSSIKSPYSSLSDRGKQASDSEEAKDLYQSFAAADFKSKFRMLTGPDAHNMLEIARNLANVNDRKDLQEYCQLLLDSIKYKNESTLEGFEIKVKGGETLKFPSLSKAKLRDGLLDKDAYDIRKLYEALHSIKLQNLTVKDLEKLQNYSNALLISATLQEAKWTPGKQITKGLLHLPGRKKNANYDLSTDVSSFMKPIYERKDKIFKDINKEVDKGINSADHMKYGPSTAVQHGQRKYEVRTFDER